MEGQRNGFEVGEPCSFILYILTTEYTCVLRVFSIGENIHRVVLPITFHLICKLAVAIVTNRCFVNIFETFYDGVSNEASNYMFIGLENDAIKKQICALIFKHS